MDTLNGVLELPFFSHVITPLLILVVAEIIFNRNRPADLIPTLLVLAVPLATFPIAYIYYAK